MDLTIGIHHLIRKFPEKEKEANGLFNKLLDAAIRIPFRIEESWFPYFKDPEELLLQARFYIKEVLYLMNQSYERGLITYCDYFRIENTCSDVSNLINRAIRRSDIPKYRNSD